MISKQTQKALSYIFAVLVIVLGSIVLVALAQGYRYDFLTGQIKETGLVLIDSKPGGADIYVNGKHTKKTTPQRLADAPIGPMSVELVKTDYRVWKKSFVVRAQAVSFADYALLIPQKLKYTNFLPDYTVSQMVESTNKKRSLIITSRPRVALWQLNGDQPPTLLYEPPAAATDASLSILSTNEDGSTIMLSQTAAGTTTYLAITGAQTSLNLTANLQITNGSFTINPANNKELYWLSSDRTLRKVNLNNQTIGNVLADSVVGLNADGNTLYLVTTTTADGGKPVLSQLDPSNSRKTPIAVSLPASASYQLDIGKPNSGDYLAVLSVDSKVLTIIKNFTDKTPLTGVLGKNTTGFSISENGDYIVYNASNTMRTYDVEEAERHDFQVGLQNLQGWSWLDEQHLIIVANNQLRLIDYDGQNDQIISNSADSVGFASLPSNSKSVVYTSNGLLRSVSLVDKN